MLSRTCRIFIAGKALGYGGLRRRCMSVSSRVIDIAAKDGELRVFIVAGEVSGDNIGARLMASLKKIAPFPVRFSGVGGPMMSQKELKSLFPMEDLAVMGIWELLPHLTRFRARLKETVKAALSFNPHVVVTVDSKGFSFRFLKQLRASYHLHHLETPIHFHYVAPSFWAWRGGEARLKGLAPFVDHIFCILPFEEEVCRLNGLCATFVGHPVLEDCAELNSVILVLPGSRLQEVTRMFPIFMKTMDLLKGSLPDLRTIMLVAPNLHVKSYINKMLPLWPVPITLIPGSTARLKYDAFSVSSAALCTSGTVAVEMQLARLPCLVAYRAHILTEWFIQFKAKVKYISLPNILLDSCVIPEALFDRCTPGNLASSLMELIRDEDLRSQQMQSAEKVIRLLCPPKSLVQNEWGVSRQPSVIAASILLHYKRVL